MEPLLYSQADITESFGDDERLGPDDWIATVASNAFGTNPENAALKNPESVGLPPPNAGPNEVHRVASKLSEMRESGSIPNDGVYCPVCHIANIDLGKLRTPCPQCGRQLLQFGWD